MGTYLVQAFNASTKICRSSFLVVLALTGAFAQHPPTSDTIVVNSCPPRCRGAGAFHSDPNV